MRSSENWRSASRHTRWTFSRPASTPNARGFTRCTGAVARRASMRSLLIGAQSLPGPADLQIVGHDVAEVQERRNNYMRRRSFRCGSRPPARRSFLTVAIHFAEAVVDWMWLPKMEPTLFLPGVCPGGRDITPPGWQIMVVRVDLSAG
jgi:hypothetical protein